jgi:hypothetical protein
MSKVSARSDREQWAGYTAGARNEHARGVESSVGLHFWYWGVLRLLVGVAQLVSVLWCFALLIHNGINARTMHAAFIGIGITTLSLLLFKVVKSQP